MPGTGFPLVISSTICAKDVGYGAGGSFAVLGGVGMIPPTASSWEDGNRCSVPDGSSIPADVGGVGGGLLRASR